MDFWIDQYGKELDRTFDIALRVSRGEIDEAVTQQYRNLTADSFTSVGLMKLFCEIVMIFDLKSLGRHDGEGLGAKISTFFDCLRHSNFTEHHANILAAVITKLGASDEKVLEETEPARGNFAKTSTQFNPKLVHPKIAMIARNLHPGINELYEKLA